MANIFPDGYQAGYQAGYRFCEEQNTREILGRSPANHGVVSQGPDWDAGWEVGLTVGCVDLNKKRDNNQVFDLGINPASSDPTSASPRLSVKPRPGMSFIPAGVLPDSPPATLPPAEDNTVWWVAAAAALGLGTWFLTSKGGK